MRTFLMALAMSVFFVAVPFTVFAADKDTSKKGRTPAVQTMETDPVCLMEVDPAKTENIYEYKGKKYYFCMKEDMEKFKKDPEKYLRDKQAPMK